MNEKGGVEEEETQMCSTATIASVDLKEGGSVLSILKRRLKINGAKFGKPQPRCVVMATQITQTSPLPLPPPLGTARGRAGQEEFMLSPKQNPEDFLGPVARVKRGQLVAREFQAEPSEAGQSYSSARIVERGPNQ